MDDGFSRSLDDWTAYFALMGGAAATLLGLLFVAVSLRLNIFHQRAVADVRDFAALTMGTFLAAMAVAGAALAPHEQRTYLVLALLVIGVAGMLAMALIARVSFALSRAATGPDAPNPLGRWKVKPYALLAAGPYAAVIVAALLLWREHPYGLGWLAISEGWLLGAGTLTAWILLAHAGLEGGTPPSDPP
jgi:tellurite resistance protein TehA-like permease